MRPSSSSFFFVNQSAYKSASTESLCELQGYDRVRTFVFFIGARPSGPVVFIYLSIVWGVAPPETGGCPFRSVPAAVGGTWNSYALDESGSREKSVGRFVPRGAESSFLPAVEGNYHLVPMHGKKIDFRITKSAPYIATQ